MYTYVLYRLHLFSNIRIAHITNKSYIYMMHYENTNYYYNNLDKLFKINSIIKKYVYINKWKIIQMHTTNFTKCVKQ